MKNEENFLARSSLQVSFVTRLLGLTITLFILILTVKSELLDYRIITWQLCLAIPFLFASLITNSKINSLHSFGDHRYFNLIVSSVATALIINTLGLLITKYIDPVIGFIYFILFLIIYMYFFIKDLKFGIDKIWNEFIILALIILFGLVPAWFVLT
jgi:hypothetical protein